jgi:V8-like Glu-specific endopeptidase
LVGHNLVLTSEHCIVNPATMGDYKVSDLNITFYKEENSSQVLQYPVAAVVARGGAGSFPSAASTGERLDFALLEVGVSTAGKTPDQDGLKPVALEEKDELDRDAAVYVVGYPSYPRAGDKMVADNAHLFVPHEITYPALNAYRLELNGELSELKSSANKLADGPEKQNQVVQAELLTAQLRHQFSNSFKSVPGTTHWRFVSDFMHPQQPTIAIDTDTFHGNSGSPVFLRKSSKVIGLFIRGYEDSDRFRKVSWREHEEAVPISAILQHWRQIDPNGPVKYGIELPSLAAAATATIATTIGPQ